MQGILLALTLILFTAGSMRVSAQVYPYRDGTPGSPDIDPR